MDKHTICLLNDSFPPAIDGVANAVSNYAVQIEMNHGHSVVVTPSYPGADDSRYKFPVLRYPSIDIRERVGFVAGLPFSPEVTRSLTTERVDLLHSHCPIVSAMLARELRDVLDVPVVLTYHTKFDIDIEKIIRSKLLQEISIRALVQNISACDEVWVVSHGAGENLRSLGYEGDYIVMNNGVDMPRGKAGSEQVEAVVNGYDLPQGVPVFLFVGRLMWYKGLRIILDALAKIHANGIDFRMVFIGDGGDGKDVRNYASELGLEGVCFFTGAVLERETLRAWYSRADLFLFPSTFDTNGLVVREAAACDLASVLVAESCAAEGVTDGQNGFLIEKTADSLAACLTRLYSNRELMIKVGMNAGRELYISWESAVANAYDRYQTVIDRYRSGKYSRNTQPLDNFFKTNGELMEALGRINTFYDDVGQKLRRSSKRMEMRRQELRQGVLEVKEAIWQKLDRYL